MMREELKEKRKRDISQETGLPHGGAHRGNIEGLTKMMKRVEKE